MKQKISVVLTVRNEEKMIKDCLESVKDFADEIVIVDDESTDKTIEIAKKYSDKIYSHTSKGYVEASRNFAIGKAANKWILLLDADERAPKELLEKLSEITKKSSVTHVFIPRKNIIFGKWIHNTGWWPDYQIRFFQKDKITWPDVIHAVPQLNGEGIRLRPEEKLAIIHENYQTISQFIIRLDRYTTVEANQSSEEFSWQGLISEPFNEFYRRFFSSQGYKDQVHGLALSALMAFYVFIVQLKIWEKHKFKDVTDSKFLKEIEIETGKVSKEMGYWLVNEKISASKNILHKSFLRVKRKI